MDETLKKIQACKNCELCKHQKPLVQCSYKADCFWVGLSAVKTSDDKDIPLSPTTNTGKLIQQIEFFANGSTFHKTNVVKCVPLNNDKIRYPSKQEMKKCFSHLEDEINVLKPKVVFLLGKQAASFVLNEYGINECEFDDDFSYKTYTVKGCKFVPVHHPSYILVYKRKQIDKYIQAIESHI